MSLIIILICLLAERFLLDYQHLRQANWLTQYSLWFERHELPDWMINGFGGVILLLLPPLLVIALLQHLLDESLFGIPGALFACAVLILSFGPQDLDNQITRLHDASKQDDEDQAATIARELMHGQPSQSDLTDPQTIAESILEQANSRIFAVIFWFLVLGPIGAAIYRLASCIPNLQSTRRELDFVITSKQLIAILDWIPARLTAASYAIAGSFEDALNGWHSYHEQRFNEFHSSSSGILICTGAGALRLPSLIKNDHPHPAESAMSLVWRSLVVWIVLIGLLTLAGWV